MDSELYKNLKFLKSYEGDVLDLNLFFATTDSSGKDVELIPNGKNT